MAAGGETCLYRFRFASTGMLILMICTSGPRYHLILFFSALLLFSNPQN